VSSARRTVLIALLVVAAGSLAVATGATVFDGPADTFADDSIAVQPADGPNGNYSYLNDDDEIVVDISAANPNLPPDFEGVNPDALASAEGVFTITHTADGYARVWINSSTNDSAATDDSVTFTANGDSIEEPENSVTLGPNESVAVGLEIDTRGEVAGTTLGPDTFAIGVDPVEDEGAEELLMQSDTIDRSSGPSITVSSPEPDRRLFAASDVSHGDTLGFGADEMALNGVDVTLDHLDLEGIRSQSLELSAAGSPGPFDDASTLESATTPQSMAYLALAYDFAPDEVDEMTLRFSADDRFLDDAEIDPEDVTLFRQTAAGDWEEIAVETITDDEARAKDLPEDRVHFRATTDEFSTFAVAQHVPRIEVTDAALDETAVEPDGEATVQATVENSGGTDGTREITLTAGGDTVAAETVALEADETTTVPLRATFETAGEYELAVAGVSAGTLTVGEPATVDGDGAGGSAAVSENGTASDTQVSEPVEEPGGIDFASLGGLLALIALVVAGVALVRRMPH